MLPQHQQDTRDRQDLFNCSPYSCFSDLSDLPEVAKVTQFPFYLGKIPLSHRIYEETEFANPAGRSLVSA